MANANELSSNQLTMGRKSLHWQHSKETTFITLELMEDVSMFWMTEIL